MLDRLFDGIQAAVQVVVFHEGKGTLPCGERGAGYIGDMTLPTPTWAVGASAALKPLAKPAPPPTKAKKSVATDESGMSDESDVDFSVLDGTGTVQVPDEIAVLANTAHLGDRDFLLLTSAQLLAQLTKEERVLRTTFVREYLFDFDPLLAAIRTGFLNVRQPNDRYSPAMNAARMLMAEPVVQRLIKECVTELVNQDESETAILTMLMREATNHGITGNAAARNTAYKMMLDGIEKRKDRNNNGDRVRGNVMAIPADGGESSDNWEKRAITSQAKLKESVRA